MRWAAFLCFGSKLRRLSSPWSLLYTVGLNGTAYRSVPPRICCGRFIPREVITWGSFDNYMCLRIRIRVFFSKGTILFWNYFTLTEKVSVIVRSHFFPWVTWEWVASLMSPRPPSISLCISYKRGHCLGNTTMQIRKLACVPCFHLKFRS